MLLKVTALSTDSIESSLSVKQTLLHEAQKKESVFFQHVIQKTHALKSFKDWTAFVSSSEVESVTQAYLTSVEKCAKFFLDPFTFTSTQKSIQKKLTPLPDSDFLEKSLFPAPLFLSAFVVNYCQKHPSIQKAPNTDLLVSSATTLVKSFIGLNLYIRKNAVNSHRVSNFVTRWQTYLNHYVDWQTRYASEKATEIQLEHTALQLLKQKPQMDYLEPHIRQIAQQAMLDQLETSLAQSPSNLSPVMFVLKDLLENMKRMTPHRQDIHQTIDEELTFIQQQVDHNAADSSTVLSAFHFITERIAQIDEPVFQEYGSDNLTRVAEARLQFGMVLPDFLPQILGALESPIFKKGMRKWKEDVLTELGEKGLTLLPDVFRQLYIKLNVIELLQTKYHEKQLLNNIGKNYGKMESHLLEDQTRFQYPRTSAWFRETIREAIQNKWFSQDITHQSSAWTSVPALGIVRLVCGREALAQENCPEVFSDMNTLSGIREELDTIAASLHSDRTQLHDTLCAILLQKEKTGPNNSSANTLKETAKKIQTAAKLPDTFKGAFYSMIKMI